MKMKTVIKSGCIYSPQNYLEAVTGKCYILSGSKPVLKQISGILKANGQPTVSYPLKKTEKALKRSFPVVLVDCSDFTDDWRLFQEYRWFRVPANFKEEAA